MSVPPTRCTIGSLKKVMAFTARLLSSHPAASDFVELLFARAFGGEGGDDELSRGSAERAGEQVRREPFLRGGLRMSGTIHMRPPALIAQKQPFVGHDLHEL